MSRKKRQRKHAAARPAGPVETRSPEQLSAASADAAPMPGLIETSPIETSPIETSPIETSPIETSPIETAAVETAAVETAAVETAAIESVPEAPPEPRAPAFEPRAPSEDDAGARARECGSQLRAARERQELSLRDAAGQLHLPWNVLDRLERGEWDLQGSPIYLRSQLRSYFLLLSMAPPAWIEDLGARPAAVTAVVPRSRPPLVQRLVQRYATPATYFALTALFVVPLVVLGLRGSLKDNLGSVANLDAPGASAPATTDAPAPRAGDAEERELPPLMASMTPLTLMEPMQVLRPAVAPPATPERSAATPAAAEGLSITLGEPSWIEVETAAGTRLAYALLQPGTHVWPVDAQARFLRVRVGNTEAAEVRFAGKRLDIAPFRHANVAHFIVAANGTLERPAPQG